MLASGHAKLHRCAGSCHRQIESMLKLDLLRLRQSERTANVGERFLRKHDGAWTHRPDGADELNVFDRLGKVVQTTAILLEEAKTRTIDLAVDQQTNQTLVTETWCERKFSLGDVE